MTYIRTTDCGELTFRGLRPGDKVGVVVGRTRCKKTRKAKRGKIELRITAPEHVVVIPGGIVDNETPD